MKKLWLLKFIYLIIILFLISIGCNRIMNTIMNSDESHEKLYEGLCIYPTKIKYTSDLSYQKIIVEEAPLIGEPLIFYDDIVAYDTTSHILSLSYPRDSLKINIGVYGEPFIVTLDSTKIYGGWFWTPISSIPCHWVVIQPNDPLDNLGTNEIRIKLGYPSEKHFWGKDPRNSRKIFDRLIKNGKAK